MAMLERSVFSARYCFVENLHRRYVHKCHIVNSKLRTDHLVCVILLSYCSGVLDDMEYECYCQWFDHIVKKDRPQIDLIGIPHVLAVDCG